MRLLQLKVTLKDTKPPIWRRILVAPEMTLDRLNDVIQIVMGWTNSHMHQFETPEGRFADPAFELEEAGNSRKITLASVLHRPKSSIRYEYDFGDSWNHQIVLEKIVDLEQSTLAACVGGARSCPPEDCGGPWGYANLLSILKDPGNPEYEETVDSVGDNFDPDFFDMESINRQLGRLGKPRRSPKAV